MTPIPVVTGTATDSPRWPRNVRIPFVADPAHRATPAGFATVWVEMGSLPPFAFKGGWGEHVSPDLADDATVHAVLAQAAAASPDVFACNFEQLSFADERTTRLHLKLMKRMRELDPNVLLSVYGVPQSDFWTFINRDAKGLATLRARNDRLTYGLASTGRRYPDRGLIPACDVMSVSGYLPKPDRDQLANGITQADCLASDAAFLRGNIAEAHRVASGKPVLVWLMSVVHETGEPLIAERLRQAFAIIAECGANPCFYRQGEDDARVAEVVGMMLGSVR